MASRQQILWDDGERVFSRVRHLGKGGDSHLLVQPSAEQPLPATLDRLAHEYGLKDDLDSTWALRPQALTREGGQTRLLLDDPGGEPLSHLLLAPLEIGPCLLPVSYTHLTLPTNREV